MLINDQCYYQMLGNNNAQRLVLVSLDRARLAVRLPVVNSSFILTLKYVTTNNLLIISFKFKT